MDRTKYHRMIKVYLSDIRALEEKDQMYGSLLRWTFFCSDISYSVNFKRCEPYR